MYGISFPRKRLKWRSIAVWDSYFHVVDSLWRKSIQSTPALRTPRYYGHPAITDSSKIPDESYRRLTEINSRYYGLSLLRTYGHFIRSQRHNFIVFSLVVIADTEQHLGIFARFLRLSYLSFLVDFRFFCLSIKILCSLAAVNEFVKSVMIQMVDRPNTTPVGQDKKTLTFKALL